MPRLALTLPITTALLAFGLMWLVAVLVTVARVMASLVGLR